MMRPDNAAELAAKAPPSRTRGRILAGARHKLPSARCHASVGYGVAPRFRTPSPGAAPTPHDFLCGILGRSIMTQGAVLSRRIIFPSLSRCPLGRASGTPRKFLSP